MYILFFWKRQTKSQHLEHSVGFVFKNSFTFFIAYLPSEAYVGMLANIMEVSKDILTSTMVKTYVHLLVVQIGYAIYVDVVFFQNLIWFSIVIQTVLGDFCNIFAVPYSKSSKLENYKKYLPTILHSSSFRDYVKIKIDFLKAVFMELV